MKGILLLDNQLCFKLYALSRQLTAVYRPLLEKMDITYPQYLVLLVLWETSSISVKDLGERLLLDSGTLTPLLKRLEAKKILTRNRDKDDERSVRIELTPAGLALKNKAAAIPETLKNCLSISMGEYNSLKTQLDQLIHKSTNHIK